MVVDETKKRGRERAYNLRTGKKGVEERVQRVDYLCPVHCADPHNVHLRVFVAESVSTRLVAALHLRLVCAALFRTYDDLQNAVTSSGAQTSAEWLRSRLPAARGWVVVGWLLRPQKSGGVRCNLPGVWTGLL